MKFLFKNKLVHGMIKSRPNRFIMLVQVNGKLEKCHCPSTGRIGNIKFENIECLLSPAEGERKTRFTVEAIKYAGEWLGINQTKANKYIEFFLKNNMLSKMIRINELQREVPVGKSRIDFLANNDTLIEVKTPLSHLQIGPDEETPPLTSFDRIIKHFHDVGKKRRAIFIMCYMYPAREFKVPPHSRKENEIVRAARIAFKHGLENWQVNLKIDPAGVELMDYFRLNLF